MRPSVNSDHKHVQSLGSRCGSDNSRGNGYCVLLGKNGEDGWWRRCRAGAESEAYQCLPCYHKERRMVINEKGMIEDHILKNHVKLDEVPYYSSLCLFRCHSLQQLNKHVTAYARHS